MATVEMNKPRLERRETVISAKEVLENLDKHTSDRAPEYGLYLMRIAGQKVRLFDLSNNEVIVRADQILHYMEKGFTIEVSDKTRDGRLKLDVLKEKGMAHRHDTVPVREPGSTDIREPFGESDAAAGSKKGKRGKADEEDDNKLMTREEWEASRMEEGEDNSGKSVTPPAGHAGVSPDPAVDQSIQESKNAENPPAQPSGALYPQDSSRMPKGKK